VTSKDWADLIWARLTSPEIVSASEAANKSVIADVVRDVMKDERRRVREAILKLPPGVASEVMALVFPSDTPPKKKPRWGVPTQPLSVTNGGASPPTA